MPFKVIMHHKQVTPYESLQRNWVETLFIVSFKPGTIDIDTNISSKSEVTHASQQNMELSMGMATAYAI